MFSSIGEIVSDKLGGPGKAKQPESNNLGTSVMGFLEQASIALADKYGSKSDKSKRSELWSYEIGN